MTDIAPTPPQRITLRDLPLSARLVLSAFLISVGIGYFSALVQLHFQHAKTGELLPTQEDAADVYHGKPGMSTLERLIRADESKPFNKSGTMRPAFFTESSGWEGQVSERAEKLNGDEAAAEKELRKERELEIEALLSWIKAGGNKEDYEKHLLPADFGKLLAAPLQNKFFNQGQNGQFSADISKIVRLRCARCHAPGKAGAAGQINLSDWKHVKVYLRQEKGGGMSLSRLAQTTHVHLLGFSMLYGLTGLILAFSSYPGWLRLIVCPLPLLAQVIDISCWWLARFDPFYAHFIMYTGGVVALGLMLHIVLSLLNMYGVMGKLILLLMFASAGGGGFLLYTQVIDPYLATEKAPAVPLEP